jgi:hypothetical protein
MIGKVTPNSPGLGWDIALEPDCSIWLTVHENEVECEPKPGDIVTIQPPYVLTHESIEV